ncbi:MAG: hypothetical protein LC789_16270 [Actinobacteria bacterium]|nr:hypothetical protein [Actinomycetota bacterium]MCA1720825.1 hypothetical protein [Actinomycetota bacterium]
MSSWLWLTLTDDEPAGVLARAALTWPDGRRQHLSAWPAGHRPAAGARRADAALVDPGGPACHAVVQWLPEGREPLFDDPAVQQVLRRLAAWPGGPLSTLTRDSTRYCGAVQALPARSYSASPLRALGPAPICQVGPGLLAVRARTLHGTQRNGGTPWPAPS